jgi:hypothetical protein
VALRERREALRPDFASRPPRGSGVKSIKRGGTPPRPSRRRPEDPAAAASKAHDARSRPASPQRWPRDPQWCWRQRPRRHICRSAPPQPRLRQPIPPKAIRGREGDVEVEPHEVRYYLERRNPECKEKMAQVRFTTKSKSSRKPRSHRRRSPATRLRSSPMTRSQDPSGCHGAGLAAEARRVCNRCPRS